MNLLIVGAGMYVTGRNGTGLGTVLACAMQAIGADTGHCIVVAARSSAGERDVTDAVAKISAAIGLSAAVTYARFDGTAAGLGLLAKREGIDAAIVATPDHLHFEQLTALMEQGIHCLCVKPLVASVEQHQALIEQADARHVYGAIEFHKRWDESNLLAKRLIQEGQFGTLHNFTVDYSQRIMIPREVFAPWVERTNIFQYLGIHYVDLILWLTGATPIRLCCRGARGALERAGINTWDSVHVWLIARQSTGTEFLVQFNLSWVDSDLSPALSDQRFAILGSDGRLELDQRNRGIALNLAGEPLQFLNPWFSEFLPSADGRLTMQGYAWKSIAQFLCDARAVRAGTQAPSNLVGLRPTFRDGLPATRVIATVNDCLAQGSEEFRNV